MALWCRDLPVVTAPKSRTPKRFTLVYPYFDCPKFFADQMGFWWQWAEDLRNFVSAVVVDDCSPDQASFRLNKPFPLRLYRIDVKVPWNWLAARNIGAHHAEDGWLLLTDMDHVVPETTVRAVVFGQHDPNVVYVFSRREHTGEVVPPHSASFLMTRAMFWKIGGYDERLSGVYGTDGLYRRRVAATAPMQVLTDELIRYEYVVDSSTRAYPRKSAEMAAEKHKRVARIPRGSTPKVLSFPYHEVAA